MKILMLLENDYERDLRVKREVQALNETGFEVIVAAISFTGQSLTKKFDKFTIYRKKIPQLVLKSSVGVLTFPVYFNFWRKYINGILKENKIDIVHVNDLPLSLIGSEIKNNHKAKLVIDLHENWPALLKHATHTKSLLGRLLSSNRQWINYEKQMLGRADMVITVVEEAQERIITLGVPKEKTCIVSNTTDLNDLTIPQRIRTNDEFILFYGGTINEHRGLQIVIKAIKRLKEKNIIIKFHIVGSGSYTKELESQVSELDIKSQVEFFGYKPFKEMLALLAEADAAIIPHLRTENNDASSPNKLYQYMALSKPVISSDCLSLKRIISGTESGFIYINNSPSDLASLLEKLVLNRQLLDDKGKNGRKAVLSGYNWNLDREKLIEAYRRLAGEQVLNQN